MICLSSGKCQIIHWRQGHKEECRPPISTCHINDDGSISVEKVAKQDQHDVYDGRYENAPLETTCMESVLPNSNCSPGVPHVKDDDIKVDSVSDAEGTCSISESSGTSFSGFSTSPSHGESSDDVSISESISSNETEGSDGQVSTNTASDMLETSLSEVDQMKPPSPKFTSLVDSVHNFNKLSKLNQSKACSNDGETQCTSSSSSGHSISTVYEGSTAKPVKVSSVFWGRTLGSVASEGNAQDDSDMLNSGGPANSKLSDSEPFSHFRFNLSRSDVPSSHAQSLDVNNTKSVEALPSALGINTPVDRAALSENTVVDGPKVRCSPSVSCERSKMDNDSDGDSNVLKSSELKSVSPSTSYASVSSNAEGDVLGKDSSKVFSSPSSRCERSNLVDNNPASTSHLSKSRLSSSASETHLAATLSGHSVSSVKFGKFENVGVDAATSSQMASFSPSSINGLKSSMLKVVDQLRGPKCGRYSDKVWAKC